LPGNLGAGDPVNPLFFSIGNLEGFTGDLNGAWRLFINDDSGTGDGGSMASWTLIFEEPYQYMWSNGPTTSSQVVMPTMTTTYYVTVSTGTQCQGTDSLTITVDTQIPLITCPPDITIECNSSTDPDSTGFATATDISDTLTIIDYSDMIMAGACPQEGTITRTWTATDTCGNSATCVQIITIDDSEAPIFVNCPPNLTIECTASTLPANTGMATATDSCGVVIITFSDVTIGGSCPQESTITRTWIASDSCGNSST
jgi:hypothetical protein